MHLYQIYAPRVQIWGPYNIESPLKSPEEQRVLQHSPLLIPPGFNLPVAGGNERLRHFTALMPDSLYPKQVCPGRWEAPRRCFLLWVALKNIGHFTIETLTRTPPPVPGHPHGWAAGKAMLGEQQGHKMEIIPRY